MLADRHGLSTDSRDHRPGPRWEFDTAVAECFPDMLERSIPGLRALRALTTDLAIAALQREKGPRRIVVDLCASRGDQLAAIDRQWGSHDPLELHAADNSEAMLDYASEIPVYHPGEVTTHVVDLADGQHPQVRPVTVTLSLFTLQFLPVGQRVRVLRRAYEHAATGGLLLVAEKIDGHEAIMAAHHRHRLRHYTREAIAAKDRALEGVMVTLRDTDTVQMLAQAGWTQATRYWQAGPFVAWAAWRGDR